MIGNKIADKITNISKSSNKLHSKTDENEIEIAKEKYISLQKKLQIIDELRLVYKYNNGILKNYEFVRQYTKSIIQI